MEPEAGLDFDVLAVVLPEGKLRLVERAQQAGHVTGMTGDGVNDAPALRRAEARVGIYLMLDGEEQVGDPLHFVDYQEAIVPDEQAGVGMGRRPDRSGALR